MTERHERPVVLLVEDEWLVRMEMADALADAGLTVLEASSGEEAVASLTEAAPDLLITDIRLSGRMNGWDVADAYRAAFDGRPVIYASANPRNDARMVAGSLFLAKPSHTEQLVDICRRLLGRTDS
jgi:CheY-like chemotaxis protein